MHHDSAQEIHVRETRLRMLRRIFSLRGEEKEPLERWNGILSVDVQEDCESLLFLLLLGEQNGDCVVDVDDEALLEIEPVARLRTCISIRMESPCKATGVVTSRFENEEHDDDKGNPAKDSESVSIRLGTL